MKCIERIMPKTDEIRYYNIIMPVWMLVLFPVTWIPVLAGNFVIDSLLLLLFLKIRKHDEIRTKWKRSILKVWHLLKST